MSALLLSFLVFFADEPSDKPTAAQVEQAHQLLNGEWEITSYTDDGENLGQGLVKAKLAKDGRVSVGARTFQIVNPETGETRIIPFRVNPLKQPKRLEVTTRDDRTIGGIYKFDGDDLIVCLESFPDSGFPSGFDAPAGSNRMLIKLHMASKTAKIETPITPPASKPADIKFESPEQHTAHAVFATARKPTTAELTRGRELFAGNWDIMSIVDDGEKLGSELIRRRFAENGQVRFGTRAFAVINPKTEERRVNAYKLDPTKSPSEIDVTTQFDTVLKGIYVFDGDKLMLAVAKDEDHARPTKFEAPGGSGVMLVNLKLAPEESVRPLEVKSTTAPVKPASTPEEDARKRDTGIRRGIVGSWSMSDSKGTLTTVFQPDGGFVTTRTWARHQKRLFGPPSDTSSGSWSYTNGQLTAWVGRTTDPRIVGHSFSGRLQTIGDDSMVLTDSYGSVKTFRKLK